jgi:hypothetical protein
VPDSTAFVIDHILRSSHRERREDGVITLRLLVDRVPNQA